VIFTKKKCSSQQLAPFFLKVPAAKIQFFCQNQRKKSSIFELPNPKIGA
jgi:hypothetical protein